MEIPKSLNLKQAINFIFDSAKQVGFSDKDTAKLLQDFLGDILSGKLGFSPNKSREKPNRN